MTGISKQPYDRDFEIAKLLQERESCLRYWNLFLGQGWVSLENGLFFWLGISIGLNVCFCMRVRYFIAAFMHAIDETTEEGVGG